VQPYLPPLPPAHAPRVLSLLEYRLEIYAASLAGVVGPGAIAAAKAASLARRCSSGRADLAAAVAAAEAAAEASNPPTSPPSPLLTAPRGGSGGGKGGERASLVMVAALAVAATAALAAAACAASHRRLTHCWARGEVATAAPKALDSAGSFGTAGPAVGLEMAPPRALPRAGAKVVAGGTSF